MMVQSDIKVLAQSGKFTIGEIREFVAATEYLCSNALVKIELDDDGFLTISSSERINRGFR